MGWATPAQANDQVAEGLQQRSIIQNSSRMAFAHKPVPELKKLGPQGFASLGMKMVIVTLLGEQPDRLQVSGG